MGIKRASAPTHSPALAPATPTVATAAFLSDLLGRCLDVLRLPGQVTARSDAGEVQGLTRHQVRVVRGLPSDGMTLDELALRLDLERASMMALADRLVRSGAARRERAAGDPHTGRLLPTVAGKTMAEDYLGHQEVAIARLVARLPDRALAALGLSSRIFGAPTGGHRSQSPPQNAPYPLESHFPQPGVDIRARALPSGPSPWPSPLASGPATAGEMSFGDPAEPLGIPAMIGLATCDRPGDQSLVEAVGLAAALSS